MGTVYRFTPLYGVQGGQPLCYLLRLGDFTVLLDCGWDDAFDLELLRPLEAVAGEIDAVLLSHPDTRHLGALPFLVGRLGCAAPVYATLPVHKMGQMFMYDQYLSRVASQEFETFDLDDVDAAFARIVPLRYQQTLSLTGKGEGIRLTALPAGHLLGGAMWRITTKEDEEVVYAVDYNHRKERHLVGAPLEAACSRPALLITDAQDRPAVDTAARDREFVEAALAALRRDGSVLVPVDTAGRVLELLLLVERHWSEHKLTYPLALLSTVAHTTLEFARSQLEWMNEALGQAIGHSRDNPFNLRYVRACQSREELSRLPHGPKLVLATLPSLEAGFARQLFAEWAGDARNALLLPAEPEAGSLAARALAAAAGAVPGAAPPAVRLALSRRVPLEGEELEEYLRRQEEEEGRRRGQAGDDAGAGGASEPGSPAGGSPRAPAVRPQRANSSAIGHLAGGGVRGVGAVVGADGLPVEESMEAAEPVACLVEGFTCPENCAAPMFPAEDDWEHAEYDEYGASLDFATLEPGESPGLHALEEEMAAEEEVPAGADPAAGPSKVVTAELTVPLRAPLLRFDYEGLADGRSARTILAHVAPRNCVLVHGSSQATSSLRAYLDDELASLHCRVKAPAAGEEVEVPLEPSFRVALSEGLLEGVALHQVGDYRLGWVSGILGTPAEGSTLPQLLPLPADEALRSSGYGGVFVGDVKLSELKRALAEAGVASEFHGGALYCAGRVVVRRSADEAGVVLEGTPGEEYYRVRDAVYGQMHIC